MQSPRSKTEESASRASTGVEALEPAETDAKPSVSELAGLRTHANGNEPQTRGAEQASVADRSHPATEVADATFHVYRFYAADDELLYVGQSARLPRRLSQHRREKDWWREVVRIELDRCESKAEALRLERDLIERRHPPYNVALNPQPRKRREAEPEEADTACCPSCGAPEAFLEFHRLVSEVWRWTEWPGVPAGELPTHEPDFYLGDPDAVVTVNCAHCGDQWPLDYGPAYCTEPEALGWLDSHREELR